MKNNQKFLKNLLTTASILTVAAMPMNANASSILWLGPTSNTQINTNVPIDFGEIPTDASIFPTQSPSLTTFSNGDSIAFGSATNTFTIGANADTTVGSVDLNGQNVVLIDLSGALVASGASAYDLIIGDITRAAKVETGNIVDSSGDGNQTGAKVLQNATWTLNPSLKALFIHNIFEINNNYYSGLGNILLGQGSTLQLNPNNATITLSGAIDGETPDNGTIETKGNVTFNGAIGAKAPLASVNFTAGSKVSLTSGAAATKFLIDNKSTVSAEGNVTGDVRIDGGQLNTFGNVTGNVTFGNGGGYYGAFSNVTGDVRIDGGGQLTAFGKITGNMIIDGKGSLHARGNVTGNVTFGNGGGYYVIFGGIFDGVLNSQTLNKGDLYFINGGTATGEIGATNPLNSINCENYSDVSGNLNFQEKVSATKLNFVGNNSFNFSKGFTQGVGGTISFILHPAYPGAATNVTVKGNITSGATGTTDEVSNGPTINLGANTLTYKQGIAKFIGDVVINTELYTDPTTNVRGVGLIIMDGGSLDLNDATSVTINLSGTATVNDAGASYHVISGASIPTTHADMLLRIQGLINYTDPTSGKTLVWRSVNDSGNNRIDVTTTASGGGGGGCGTVTIPPTEPGTTTTTTIVNPNAYIQTILVSTNTGACSPPMITTTVVDKIKEGLTTDFVRTPNEGIIAVLMDSNGKINKFTDAADVINDLGLMSEVQADGLQQQMVDGLKVLENSEAVSNASTQVLMAAQNKIGARLDNVLRFTQESDVAAGDEDLGSSYGAWVSPLYSIANQGQRNNAPGYKSKGYGGTLGFDYLINDRMTLGIAATMVNTKLTHKNKKAGDSTKVDTTLFSIYGAHQFSGNWFIQGLASYGLNKVQNSEKRITLPISNNNAIGKYNSISYSGELFLGYKYALNNGHTLITPMGGLRYSKFDDDGYTETGAITRNVTVAKKSFDKIEGILGLRASLVSVINKIELMPEFHGFVNYAFKSKTPTVEARINGGFTPLPTTRSKAAKTLYKPWNWLNRQTQRDGIRHWV